MARPSLENKKVACVATHGFEQSELIEPVQALRDAGATVEIIAPKPGAIKAWNKTDWGEEVAVDRTLADASPDDYDALLLPGGVMSPDKLRMSEDAKQFVRAFFKAGKPVSAICHGPQILIDCNVVEGRTLTSYPSVRQDLINAGATWVDEQVVVDQGLTTSRTPDDLPAFIDKTIEEISEGKHARQHA